MNPKTITAMIAGGLVAIFILQNLTGVEYEFLFWKIYMSRSILLLIVFALGMLAGWLTHAHVQHKKERAHKHAATD